MKFVLPICGAMLLAAPLLVSPLAAGRPHLPSGPPAVVTDVLACRTIADAEARLRCFDAAAARLDQADASGDIAVVDKQQVEQARRSLFGFNLPSLDIFGHHSGNAQKDMQDDEIKEITATIARVGQGGDGWVITMEDGARWVQADSTMLGLAPRPGKQVTIRRGPLGSYKMYFGSQAMKVNRVQ